MNGTSDWSGFVIWKPCYQFCAYQGIQLLEKHLNSMMKCSFIHRHQLSTEQAWLYSACILWCTICQKKKLPQSKCRDMSRIHFFFFPVTQLCNITTFSKLEISLLAMKGLVGAKSFSGPRRGHQKGRNPFYSAYLMMVVTASLYSCLRIGHLMVCAQQEQWWWVVWRWERWRRLM